MLETGIEEAQVRIGVDLGWHGDCLKLSSDCDVCFAVFQTSWKRKVVLEEQVCRPPFISFTI